MVKKNGTLVTLSFYKNKYKKAAIANFNYEDEIINQVQIKSNSEMYNFKRNESLLFY